MAIRLRPFDDSLPPSIDSRVKERKQGTNVLFYSFLFWLFIYLFIYEFILICLSDQIEKTKEFKQKMVEMQEKVEQSRLTLFERYKVETAGKYAPSSSTLISSPSPLLLSSPLLPLSSHLLLLTPYRIAEKKIVASLRTVGLDDKDLKARYTKKNKIITKIKTKIKKKQKQR